MADKILKSISPGESAGHFTKMADRVLHMTPSRQVEFITTILTHHKGDKLF